MVFLDRERQWGRRKLFLCFDLGIKSTKLVVYHSNDIFLKLCRVNSLSYLMILTLEGSPSAKRPDQSRSFSRLSELDPLSPSNAPASTKKPLRWKGHFRLAVIHIRSILYPPFPERVFWSAGPGHGNVRGYHLPSCKAILMVEISPASQY